MNETLIAQLHVLVVDDKAFIRNMLADILARSGIGRIATAADGNEAMAYKGQANPPVGLLFCDLMMPDMDGIEVVRHVASLEHRPGAVRRTQNRSRLR